MINDAGGVPWLVIDVGLVLVLAGALVYGTVQWRRWKQHPVRTAEREQATRELFDKQ